MNIDCVNPSKITYEVQERYDKEEVPGKIQQDLTLFQLFT